MTRRRTPGLRREEVALLANVSPTWYTWLEQGRSGTPSTDVLDRLAKGLRLTDAEREYLYLLAQNRPPELIPREPETVSLELQNILDSFEFSPAMIRNSAWDALAANAPARVLWEPLAMGAARYNVLEDFFLVTVPRIKDSSPRWTEFARIVVARFRAEAFQAGFGPRAQEVVRGLLASSPDFGKLWSNLEVGLHFEPIKTFVFPGRGALSFQVAQFSVDDQPGLKLVVLTPASLDDRLRVQQLLDEFSSLNRNTKPADC
jgi:transcriptional regulator with XRE-family HTH domain